MINTIVPIVVSHGHGHLSGKDGLALLIVFEAILLIMLIISVVQFFLKDEGDREENLWCHLMEIDNILGFFVVTGLIFVNGMALFLILVAIVASYL